MAEEFNDLPEHISEEFFACLQETEDGQWEVVDKLRLVKLVAEHGAEYPVLRTLFTVDKNAVLDHYERTGEVVPGLKLFRKTRESEKVTRLEVLRSGKHTKSDYEKQLLPNHVRADTVQRYCASRRR